MGAVALTMTRARIQIQLYVAGRRVKVVPRYALGLHLDPPPGSGSLLFRIRRVEYCLRQEWPAAIRIDCRRKYCLSQDASFVQAPAVAQKPKSQCDIRASFATAFHNWRLKSNIPLKKIASDLGLAASTVNSWELGKRFPTGRNFEMLVDYTGVPPCKLFCVMADIPGGQQNMAAGSFSFAAGQQAQALHQGAFVWADSQSGPFASTAVDQFSVRAEGGVRFVTGSAGVTLDGNLNLPATTATAGIIYSGAYTLLHTYGTQNLFAGRRAGNLTMSGSENTGVGDNALINNDTGGDNTASGAVALTDNTTGSDNTASGFGALNRNQSGSQNTAIGSSALVQNYIGWNNTAVGSYALGNLGINSYGDGGTNNIALGYEAGHNFRGNESGNIDIGNPGIIGENNTIRLGDPTVQTTTYIAGAIQSPVFGSPLTVNAGAGTLTVRNDGGYEGLVSAGSGGYLRFRNDLEVWPNDAGTASGFVDVRNTSGTQTIVLNGANGRIDAGNVYANGIQLTSDRNAKENFTAVNARDGAGQGGRAAGDGMELQDGDAAREAHRPDGAGFSGRVRAGGADDKHISVVDVGGVALAAIQGLNLKLEAQAMEKDAEIQDLKQRLETLEKIVLKQKSN